MRCCSRGWLVALLVAVSEAPTWGWGSPKTIGLIVFAAVIAVAWVVAELRSRHPLVDMHMMRLPGVWTTNLAALLLGFGMYSAFVLIPQYVQTPTSTGYGFGASVTQAGLFLIPATIGMLVFSPIGGRLSTVVGSKVPLVAGTCVTTVSFVVLAASHAPWGVYVASSLLGIGVGFAFAALANLIVEAVRPDQTGVASGMNTIVRTIGGAIGAEVAASILAATVRRLDRLPDPARLHRHLRALRRRPRGRRARLARRPRPPARRRRRHGGAGGRLAR